MALTKCPECGRQMSTEAAACPGCGAVNKRARNQSMNRNQGCGCVLLLLSIPAFIILTPLGGIVLAVVGLIVMVMNTRLK